MKKIMLCMVSLLSASVYADNLYLEPLYSVGIESGSFESSNNTLTTKTVTPIVYEDRLLNAGESIMISCIGNKSVLKQIGSSNVNIPVELANPQHITAQCTSNNLGLFWAKDEYKITSDQITKIDDKAFKPEPFNETQNDAAKGMVLAITSDDHLLNITVNKAKYFNKAKFYGTVNGRDYLLQTSNDDELFTIHAANLDKLTILDKDGSIISTIIFP